MGFLSFLGFGNMVEDGAKVLEFPKPKVVQPIELPKPAPKPEPKEHYRIGYVSETKMTTFTILSDYGSTTLSMNKPACEQLIKMLRATYEDDEDEGNPTDDPDGGLPLPEETKDKKVA